MTDRLTVFRGPAGDISKAEKLADALGAGYTEDAAAAEKAGVYLRFDGDGLSLCGNGQTIRADLSKMLRRIAKNNLYSELAVKAANPKKFASGAPAVDATAGFGEDSLLLAAAGFDVTMYEYDPVIAALLEDALERAGTVPELADAVSRMKLIKGDSITAMREMKYRPAVIMLDPMFPERRKSALVKKKFQLLHILESPCADECSLLEAAVCAKPEKIIIKRPLKGAYLAGVRPAYSLSGKAIRFDCIIP